MTVSRVLTPDPRPLTESRVTTPDPRQKFHICRPPGPKTILDGSRVTYTPEPSRGGSRNLFGGGQTKVPNRKLRAKPNRGRQAPEFGARVWRAKPESRARSARELRAKPESRARSAAARELRAKPEPRAKPEKKRGEGLGEPLPRKILKSKLEIIHFGACIPIWSNIWND